MSFERIQKEGVRWGEFGVGEFRSSNEGSGLLGLLAQRRSATDLRVEMVH